MHQFAKLFLLDPDSMVCWLTLILWIAIYPVDSIIQPSNNLDLICLQINM